MNPLQVSVQAFRDRLVGRSGRRIAWLSASTVAFALFLRHFDVAASGWLPSMVAFLVGPLAALGCVRATVGRQGFTSETARLVAFGVTPWRAAGTLAALAIASSALVVALLASVALLLGHSYADPPRLIDAPATFLIAAGTGSALACVFLFTHTFLPFLRSFMDTAIIMLGGVAALPQSAAFALLQGHLETPWRSGAVLVTVSVVALALAFVRSRARRRPLAFAR